MSSPWRAVIAGQRRSLRASLERLHGFFVAAAITGSTILACLNRFLQDDAYISFRYAENLARGIGLVFNEGERVEGFTNFLWTLLLALGIRLGVEPEVLSQIMGIACFAGTLGVTYALAVRVIGGKWPALLVVGLLGTNYSFVCYATGGLETQSQALLVTATAYLAVGLDSTRPSLRRLATFSVLAALALMTRLDSAVAIGPLIAGVVLRLSLQNRHTDKRGIVRGLTALSVPLLAIIGPFLVFKLVYYGAILPNTMVAKTGLPLRQTAATGAAYVATFMEAYGLIPGVLAVVGRVGSIVRDGVRLPLLAIPVLWVLYLLWTGGDFMEFRFVIPILPITMLMIVDAVVGISPVRWVRVALLFTIPLGSLRHSERTRLEHYVPGIKGVETIAGLHAHVAGFNQDWPAIGRALASVFGEDSSITIAVPCAGAIPYYARLRTIDMMGLNDAWIARHGQMVRDMRISLPIGHVRWAPPSYLLERNVNLIVAPVAWTDRLGYVSSYKRSWARFFGWKSDDPLPAEARVLRIPVEGDHEAPLLYLTPSAAVDRAIEEHHLKVFEFQPDVDVERGP